MKVLIDGVWWTVQPLPSRLSDMKPTLHDGKLYILHGRGFRAQMYTIVRWTPLEVGVSIPKQKERVRYGSISKFFCLDHGQPPSGITSYPLEAVLVSLLIGLLLIIIGLYPLVKCKY